MTQRPRQLKPEIERDYRRSAELGYEPQDESGMIRCLSHGYPTPLARWHCHDEYEIHIITATFGKAFIGDWIGQFRPGHVVLTGPRLPHNWISASYPEGGVPQRDLVIQFSYESLQKCIDGIPEARLLFPLLEKSRHGIEFFEIDDVAASFWHRIKSSTGLRRLGFFFELLAELAQHKDYRLLSSVQMRGDDKNDDQKHIHAITNQIVENIAFDHSMTDLARQYGMSPTKFSRFFRRSTGNTFSDFLCQVRIQRACHLLMETDRPISSICYEVGFNNISNFNRRFLDVKGSTPSNYRKEMNSRFGA